jgi:hypothetical protein
MIFYARFPDKDINNMDAGTGRERSLPKCNQDNRNCSENFIAGNDFYRKFILKYGMKLADTTRKFKSTSKWKIAEESSLKMQVWPVWDWPEQVSPMDLQLLPAYSH